MLTEWDGGKDGGGRVDGVGGRIVGGGGDEGGEGVRGEGGGGADGRKGREEGEERRESEEEGEEGKKNPGHCEITLYYQWYYTTSTKGLLAAGETVAYTPTITPNCRIKNSRTKMASNLGHLRPYLLWSKDWLKLRQQFVYRIVHKTNCSFPCKLAKTFQHVPQPKKILLSTSVQTKLCRVKLYRRKWLQT